MAAPIVAADAIGEDVVRTDYGRPIRHHAMMCGYAPAVTDRALPPTRTARISSQQASASVVD